jgi:hypothetical protein
LLTTTASLTSQASSTKSNGHIQQAKEWLERCSRCHKQCNGVGDTPRELPRRLLHVAPGPSGKSHPVLRIVLTDGLARDVKYFAFSHCWGCAKSFELTRDNYDESLRKVDYADLSKNMMDAVKIALRLGGSYIWIDSVCIIQDSTEDFDREITKMGSVYSGAYCTIASTGSPSGNDGCFHERNSLSLRPCEIGVSSSQELLPCAIYARRDDIFAFERGVDKAPLNKRAWCLQERLLSRRILHFGAEMIYWECHQRAASELNPNGYTYKPIDNFQQLYQRNVEGVNSFEDAMALGWTFAESGASAESVRHAELMARARDWAKLSMFHHGPPPTILDPDDPPTSNSIWEIKRRFWKQVRKPDPTPWENDTASESGFRAAFNCLRYSLFWDDEVGHLSFSYYWYEIVEVYTRGGLSNRCDKLRAINAIVKEVQRSTRFTHLAGLWKESLLVNLLWFAAEGPGCRPEEELRCKCREKRQPEPEIIPDFEEDHGFQENHRHDPAIPQIEEPVDSTRNDETLQNFDKIAPTWSWASIDGTVALDILPEDSDLQIEVLETLATASVVLGQKRLDEEYGAIKDAILEVKGPLCQVKAQSDGSIWSIETDKSHRRAGRFFPDSHMWNEPTRPELWCLPCLKLNRGTRGGSKKEIQGLVLTRVKPEEEVYKRVGYFTTSRMRGSGRVMRELKEAPVKIVRII